MITTTFDRIPFEEIFWIGGVPYRKRGLSLGIDANNSSSTFLGDYVVETECEPADPEELRRTACERYYPERANHAKVRADYREAVAACYRRAAQTDLGIRYETFHWQTGNMALKFQRCVLPMLVLMLMAGCYTHPSASLVQPWPSPPPDGYAMLMIYWNQTGFGGGPSIYIDDVKAFDLRINRYTWIYVRAGKHTLRTKWGFGAKDLNMSHGIPFKAGESYYLRLRNWKQGGPIVVRVHVALDQVSERTATIEAATCWFHKPLVLQVDTTVK